MAGKLTKDSLTQRYDRYWPVINLVSGQENFDIESVKQACDPEKPAFITRIVNELVEQGWLIREADSGSYQWNSGRGEFSPTKWLDEKLFGNQVQAAPEQDRPRERLLALGADNLKNSELLAILIRSGRPGESAVAAGEKLAKEFDGRLEQLTTAGRGELKSISPAIEKTAYCQIMSGIELGRRVAALSGQNTSAKIGGPADAMAFCQRHFARLASDAKQEEFHIVTLSTKNQVIDTHQITVGTLDASLVHPREVFRAAIKDAASSVILVHNHPSGDPTPSPEDLKVTERLTEAGKTLGIEVLDHIVLGKGSAVSIRESR
ncbi:MAG: DNA repair protein RadC [Pirellulaceae bacterium]